MKTFYTILAAMFLTAGLIAQTEVTIYEIQGQTSASPYVNQIVTTHGIVTAISFNGFYIQDGDGAWNGVFVYNNTYSPSMGDDVTLTAKVQEYYEMTELSNVTAFTVESSGNPLPVPVVITALEAQSESYESVLSKVENVTVTELPDQYGIWTAKDQNNDDLRVDDDIYLYTPTMNEELSLIGIMTYTYDEHKLNPRSIDDIIGGSAGQEVSIYDIQGQGAASPYDGQVISTSGIVTGVAFNGYAIQDGTGPWNGLFVFDGDNIPVIGDEVKVTGEVQEYYDMTELGYISSFSVESQGNQLPAAVVITALQSNMEDYESVLVQVQNVEVTESPDQYGVWRGIDGQGADMVMDDDMYSYTPTIGDHLTITGVMLYGFGEYKLNPRMADDITPFIGIVENKNNVQITIYPNPATDAITISANEKISSFEIYNPSGALVIKRSGLQVSSVAQDVTNLTKGIYLIKVEFVDFSFDSQKISIR